MGVLSTKFFFFYIYIIYIYMKCFFLCLSLTQKGVYIYIYKSLKDHTLVQELPTIPLLHCTPKRHKQIPGSKRIPPLEKPAFWEPLSFCQSQKGRPLLEKRSMPKHIMVICKLVVTDVLAYHQLQHDRPYNLWSVVLSLCNISQLT